MRPLTAALVTKRTYSKWVRSCVIAACTIARDESHPGIILQYLLDHDLCKVTQQPAAFCIKLPLLAVNDAPVRQTQHTFTPSSEG